MKKLVAEIFFEDDDESVSLSLDFAPGLTFVEQLGYLEWAKLLVVKGIERSNALVEYGKDES